MRRRSALLTATCVLTAVLALGAATVATRHDQRNSHSPDDRSGGAAATSSGLLPLRLLPPATEATLTYCRPGGFALKMDFYRPSGRRAPPVVVQAHAGGWVLGTRTQWITPKLVSAFLKKGIALATIDYRLFDARHAIEDVACAVRYLRASAPRLRINPKRIGAMGQSAGGQLVSLLGTSGPSAGFDVGQYRNRSSRVQAVVDEWGPVIFDATLLKRLHIREAFGTSDLNALQKYAPLTYVTKDDPPFLIVHGAQDDEVPLYQSKDFMAGLKTRGVSARLIISQHAGHQMVPAGGAPTPSLDQIQASVVAFFVAHLSS